MAKKTVKKQTKDEYEGLFIPAGIFLGLGIGMIFDATGAGVILGLGVGFLGMAIARMIKG